MCPSHHPHPNPKSPDFSKTERLFFSLAKIFIIPPLGETEGSSDSSGEQKFLRNVILTRAQTHPFYCLRTKSTFPASKDPICELKRSKAKAEFPDWSEGEEEGKEKTGKC